MVTLCIKSFSDNKQDVGLYGDETQHQEKDTEMSKQTEEETEQTNGFREAKTRR